MTQRQSPPAAIHGRGRWVRLGAGGLIALLLAIQLVPYGHQHTNPPVGTEPAWPSAQTRQLAVRACYDCHSNQTVWPWYSNIAPMSWLVQRDVIEGRARVNFSQWNRSRTGGLAEPVQKGSMPPWYYVLLHPQAQLSPSERQTLVQGLTAIGGQGGH